MKTLNINSFRIIRKNKNKKIGEFRLFVNKDILVFIDYKKNKMYNKGNASDFFRLLNLYRKAEHYNTIENLDEITKKTEELFNSGKIIL